MKIAQAGSDQNKVSAHHTKHDKNLAKQIAELKDIRACLVIFNISRFQDAESI